MGFLELKPEQHVCEKPTPPQRGAGEYGLGTLWECDRCSTVYELIVAYSGGYAWSRSAKTRRIQEKRETMRWKNAYETFEE